MRFSLFAGQYWLIIIYLWALLIAQLVKTLPAMQETPVWFLGREDLLWEGLGYPLQYSRAFLVAQLVENLPEMWETWVWPLGWEDPLEKGKDITPVFWPGEFHGLHSPWGRKESDMTEWLSLSFFSYLILWLYDVMTSFSFCYMICLSLRQDMYIFSIYIKYLRKWMPTNMAMCACLL